MVDGDGQPAGNRSGERDPACARSTDGRADRNRKVDAPVPGVRTNRSKRARDEANDGGLESCAGDGGSQRNRHHEGQCNDGGHGDLFPPPPPGTLHGRPGAGKGVLFTHGTLPRIIGEETMTVHYEVADRIATVTIDRPATRNAIDLATADALLAAWRGFDADANADVGILTGAGGTFCAGADLKRFDLVDRPEGHLGMSKLEVGKPTIAAIEGHAVAGGLELALWCDLRVMAADAELGCFERRWGVPLIDGGTQRLPRIVGMGRAMDLILTGRGVLAAEALEIGLANRVSPPGEALQMATDLAARIARFPQPTVRSDRLSVLGGAGRPLRKGLAIERELGIAVLDTAAEGAARFSGGAGRHGAGT